LDRQASSGSYQAWTFGTRYKGPCISRPCNITLISASLLGGTPRSCLVGSLRLARPMVTISVHLIRFTYTQKDTCCCNGCTRSGLRPMLSFTALTTYSCILLPPRCSCFLSARIPAWCAQVCLCAVHYALHLMNCYSAAVCMPDEWQQTAWLLLILL
jgi:hypothetical protein